MSPYEEHPLAFMIQGSKTDEGPLPRRSLNPFMHPSIRDRPVTTPSLAQMTEVNPFKMTGLHASLPGSSARRGFWRTEQYGLKTIAQDSDALPHTDETDVTLSQGSQLVIPETQLDNIAANSQSQMVMSEVEGTLNKNDLVESMSRDISEEQTLFEAPNSPGNTVDRNMGAISTPTDDEKPEDKEPTHSDDEKTEDKEATHSDDEKSGDKPTHSDDEKPEDQQPTHSDDEKPGDKQSTRSDDEKPEDKPTHSDEKRDDAQSPQEVSTIISNPAEKQKQQQVSPMDSQLAENESEEQVRPSDSKSAENEQDVTSTQSTPAEKEVEKQVLTIDSKSAENESEEQVTPTESMTAENESEEQVTPTESTTAENESEEHDTPIASTPAEETQEGQYGENNELQVFENDADEESDYDGCEEELLGTDPIQSEEDGEFSEGRLLGDMDENSSSGASAACEEEKRDSAPFTSVMNKLLPSPAQLMRSPTGVINKQETKFYANRHPSECSTGIPKNQSSQAPTLITAAIIPPGTNKRMQQLMEPSLLQTQQKPSEGKTVYTDVTGSWKRHR